MDLRARRAWVRGVEIELTVKEFDLLRLFVSNPGQVFTKVQLFDKVWGEEFIGGDNTVMVHIRRLRTKVEADPSDPQLIKTVWGIGYRFEARDDEGALNERAASAGLQATGRPAGAPKRGDPQE